MPEQTFTDPIVIDSGADETQLKIQGSGNVGSEQTAPLLSWQTADAVEQARITGDGRFQVGSFDGMGGMDTDDALIEAHRSETDTNKPTRGLHLLGAFTGTLSSVITWIVHELVLKGSGGISTLHSALRIRLTNENDGDMTGAELLGGDIEVQNDGGNSGGSGKVLSAVGLRVGVNNQANGYLDTGKGLEIEMVDSGAADTLIGLDIANVDGGSVDNFAIRTGTGKVKLGSVTTGLLKTVAGEVVNIDPDDDSDAVMIGATDTVDGSNGLVPQPLAGDESKFLRGDKIWAVPSGGGGVALGADGRDWVDPTLQTWTAFNQGSGTFDDTDHERLLAYADGNGSDEIRGYYMTAPSTPYIMTAYIKAGFIYSNTHGLCFGFRSSDGKFSGIHYAYSSYVDWPSLSVQKWNGYGSYNSDYLADFASEPIHWMQLEDNGTNRYYRVSVNGRDWVDLHSVSRTNFHTANGIAFYCCSYANTGGVSGGVLLSLEEE